MSRYFSRIARHGGARIKSDGSQRGGTRTAKTEPHLAPIDDEETVMIPSSASSEVPASRELKPNRNAAVQDQLRRHKTAARSTSAIHPPSENLLAEAKRTIPLEPVNQEINEEVKLMETQAPRDSAHAMLHSPVPEEKRIETRERISTGESLKQTPADLGPAETPGEKSIEKKFFEKTVEIVEGQLTRPPEVHTILLREVQEWIAAAQATPADVPADLADSAAEPLPETSLPNEREPGVIRIADRRAKPASTVVREISTTDFSEQVFELSIGSISVVVEGDERTPAPSPAAVPAQSAARETPRRMSRLSRHYL